MAIAGILALFAVLLLFSPRLAVALLVVAIVLLYRKRAAAAHTAGAREVRPAQPQQKAWKDPLITAGFDR